MLDRWRAALAPYFLDPAAGVHLWALLVILLLYMLRLKRQQVVIPSAYLWEQLARDERANAFFSRLRSTLLLFVQLLAALAMVLALMRPFQQGGRIEDRVVVLVLDGSASMQATDIAPSRFEGALERAREIVRGAPRETRFALVVAEARARPVFPFGRDHQKLQSVLGSLKASDGPGRLEEAIGLARSMVRSLEGASDGGDARIHVITDGSRAVMDTVEAGPDLVLHRVGGPGKNVGITRLDVRRIPGVRDEYQVFLTLTSYIDEARPTGLELKLDGQLVDSRTVDIPPLEQRSLVLTNVFEGGGRLEVALTAKDDLAVDDRAYAVLTGEQARRVVVLGDAGALGRVLELLPGLEVETAVPGQDFSKLPASALVVAVRSMPAPVPPCHLWLLHPPPGNEVVPYEKDVEGPPVADWDPLHPVARFLTFDGLIVDSAASFPERRDMSVVLEAAGGPLVLAGEAAGRRTLAMAFDPGESNLPSLEAFPILVANAMGWFFPEPEGEQRFRTGEVPSLAVDAGETSLTWTTPDGEKSRLAPVNGVVDLTGTERVGFYQLDTGRRQRTFAANLLDPAESDIVSRDTWRMGGQEVKPGGDQIEVPREMTRWVLLLVLILLVVEWAIEQRRWHR